MSRRKRIRENKKAQGIPMPTMPMRLRKNMPQFINNALKAAIDRSFLEIDIDDLFGTNNGEHRMTVFWNGVPAAKWIFVNKMNGETSSEGEGGI